MCYPKFLHAYAELFNQILFSSASTASTNAGKSGSVRQSLMKEESCSVGR